MISSGAGGGIVVLLYGIVMSIDMFELWHLRFSDKDTRIWKDTAS